MRKNLLLLLSLIFSFFSAFCKNANTATPTIYVTPKPSWISSYKPYNKAPLARDVENGAFDELIEEQINVEKQATYNHIITQIVSESGVQNNSEISVSFDPSYEHVDFHEIIIWRNNKSQSRLNIDAFKILPDENEFDKFIYNGTYSAKYILADIRKGDKIEYSYTVTGFNPIFYNKFCRSIYFQGSNLIAHQYTTLLFSTNRKLNIKSFNLRSQPKIYITGNLKRYEWEDYQVPGAITNKLEPKWVNEYAHAQVSEYDNWGQVINWGLKINPLQITFTGELADSISKLKRQFGKDEEKYFRAAVRLVQDEIRYMGIETGQYSHKANTPDKVFKQRYGDCKDKSLLLASILNADGIEAHMALVNTELEDKIEAFIPSTSLFDHAVVVSNINGKQVWVDATMANQGGKGVGLYFPPYKEALILKNGGTGLTKINETKTGKIVCKEKYTIKNEYSPVKLNVITTYTLDEADYERDHIATTGTAQTEKNYLDYYSKTYNKIEVSDSIIIKDNREKNQFTTIENYTINSFFKRDSLNGKYTADFYADNISDQLPKVPGQIKTPISVNYPYDLDYTISVILPYGWDIADDHYTISRDAYNFTSDRTISGDELSLHYRFKYLRDYISIDKLTEFKQDIKDLRDDKLGYGFSYIPDLKKTPFHINVVALFILTLIAGLFLWRGLKIYKTETRESQYYTKNDSFRPALGGWLIVLMIMLFATPLSFISYLLDDDYFSMSKWNQITTGISSIYSRLSIILFVTGYVSLICYSVFCIILALKKRDITPYYIKGLCISIVVFLFVNSLFDAFINGKFADADIYQIIKAVVYCALWTYYLNTSSRVKKTFVVPHPD